MKGFWFASILRFVGYRFLNASTTFDNSHLYPRKEYKRYSREDPDERLRVTYPLSEESIVIDVGGYIGDWAMRMFCMYRCNIDIYEPHPDFMRICKQNFGINPKIRYYNEAISDSNGIVTLYGNDRNTSLFQTGGTHHVVETKKASEVFNRRYSHIDVLKVNAEGAEYPIFKDLLENYDMNKIRDIQIQFHGNVPNYKEMKNNIERGLSKTHKKTWGYEYIFENWTKI